VADEAIFCLRRRTPETAVGYHANNERRSRQDNGDSQMRTLSFILAFAFVLAGPSMAGSYDSGLPGIGTFAYNGSPIASSAPQTILVAVR
jgi:hypothetical protein